MDNKNEYPNVIISGVWTTKNGHFNTAALDQKAYDVLQTVLETGGKFLIRKRSKESIMRAKDPTNTPPYYLEFVPASEVEAFNSKRRTNAQSTGI